MFGFVLFLVGIIFGGIIGILVVEHRCHEASEKVSDIDMAKDLSEECYPDPRRDEYPSDEEYELAVGRVYDHRNAYVNGFVGGVHVFNSELGLNE